jgi:hypothetical protein
MKESLTAQEDIGISVKPRVSTTSISSHGSTSVDGKASGRRELAIKEPLRSLQPSQAQDILSKLRSIKPSLIKLEDQKAVKSALPLLELSMIPATYEDCAYWIGRLLAHFPRRDTTKDGIVISDIASDLVEEEIPHTALIATCDELRRESTDDKPWMPPSGEIIQRARKRATIWEGNLKYFSQDWEEVKTRRQVEKNVNSMYTYLCDQDPKAVRRRAAGQRLLREKPFDKWTKWEKKFFVALHKYREKVEADGEQKRVEKYGRQPMPPKPIIDEEVPF